MRIVVIGGDATGMSAASQVNRLLGDEASITVIERQHWTSYSACGIPYWVAGDVAGPDALVARSPEQHRANGIDVRTSMTATDIDLAAQTVTAESPVGTESFSYDHLIVATGATPVSPAIDGIDLPGVYRVHTLDQGQAAIDSLALRPRRAVVLGAGYIGLEMAEAALSRGLDTTIIDLAPEPMATLDPQMGALIREGMTQRGVTVRMGERAHAVRAGADGRVAAVVTDVCEYPADIVFLGLGVRPRTDLAASAGLPVGEAGGLLTDDRQRVMGFDNIWSGGDCTEVTDRQTGRRLCVPLGTHANKHGRVIGLNISGRDVVFPGIVRTAITKFEDIEVARVGLPTAEAEGLGMDVAVVTVQATTQAGYMPGSCAIHVRMSADRSDGKVLGTQIVGGPGSGKRIDTAATAIWAGLTVGDVIELDLSYSPPFSPVWDPVQTAARALLSRL